MVVVLNGSAEAELGVSSQPLPLLLDETVAAEAEPVMSSRSPLLRPWQRQLRYLGNLASKRVARSRN